MITEAIVEEREQTVNEANKPSTPPARSEAFEEFKRERGSEINRILNENKSVLKEKQKTASALATSINTAKKQIDEARLVIEQKKHERMEEDGLVDEEGEPIISEEEFSALSRLREVTASEPRAPMFYWTPRPPF
jgi:kinesin family protein 6/9